MQYENIATVRLLIIAEIYGLPDAELCAHSNLQSAGKFADLNAVAQFSSDKTENFCNNQQSHSRNILILHESL